MGVFAREILPGLGDVAASTIAKETGVSRGYLRRVKAGEVIPHPMWWDSFRAVALGEP
jgi:predicted transcriptional regulator